MALGNGGIFIGRRNSVPSFINPYISNLQTIDKAFFLGNMTGNGVPVA